MGQTDVLIVVIVMEEERVLHMDGVNCEGTPRIESELFCVNPDWKHDES